MPARAAAALGALLAFSAAASSSAEEPDLLGTDVLGRPSPFRIESVRMRYTHFDQTGLGYQSQAGPPRGPGSQQLTVDQPQLEIIATQGDKLTHRLWLPIDVVSSASADAIDDGGHYPPPDAITEASRLNVAGTMDLLSTYKVDRDHEAFFHGNFHLEEEWRSWAMGVGGHLGLAEGNATLAASVNQVFDWFDSFHIDGVRAGHRTRSATNANLGITQLLSPSTVANLNYGGTVQLGTLGNGWNGVPLSNGTVGSENLPTLRHRHAFVGRLAQWLPWQGAIKGFYRFYVDNWGIKAHTLEAELYQRIGPRFYLRGSYRFHWQSGADFYTINAPADGTELRTADSDLAPFWAQTLGIKASLDLRFPRWVREAHIDIGYDRYFRSNNLTVDIYSCAIGLRFY